MAEFIARQRNGRRLYAAQAHRHRCNCGNPCDGGSGTTGRRDDGDNAEPVARGDYGGQISNWSRGITSIIGTGITGTGISPGFGCDHHAAGLGTITGITTTMHRPRQRKLLASPPNRTPRRHRNPVRKLLTSDSIDKGGSFTVPSAALKLAEN
jgi:hypothetical protein